MTWPSTSPGAPHAIFLPRCPPGYGATSNAWEKSLARCGASRRTAIGGDARSTTERLVALDDEMDDLHVTFIAELVAADTPVVVAIELALVARFYERLGDHAVNLARRVPSRPRPIVP